MKKVLDKITKHSLYTLTMSIIGIVGFALMFYEKSPKVHFVINSSSVLLDSKAEMPSLKILLDSVNIRESNENIAIYSIKFENIGDANLIENFYIKDYLPTLKIYNGRFLGKPKISSQKGSQYADSVSSSILYSDSTVAFPRIALNKGEGYVIEIMALYKESIPCEIAAFGGISGQETIEIINNLKSSNLTFFEEFIAGNIWMHLTRLLVYGIILVFILFVGFWVYERLDSYRIKRKKHNIVEKFRLENTISQSDGFVCSEYIKQQFRDIEHLNEIMQKSEEEVTSIYQRELEYAPDAKNINDLSGFYIDRIKQLIDFGAFEIRGENIIIRKSAQETMQKFIDFLIVEKFDKSDYEL